MNFKKRVNGSWHDIPHYIHKTSTDTITTLPAVLYPNDTTAMVGLKGQAVQSGTPTPQNPIMPQGTGERTGNWLDIYANNTSNGYVNNALLRSDGSTYSPSSAYISEYLPLEENTTYTYYTGGRTGVAQAVCFYNAAKEYISGVPYDNQTAITFTTPQGTKYYRCTVMRTASDTESYKKATLNLGLTALPYEPYGYKIPISSASTTTPIYLGEVESTRRIKKLILTGEENWKIFSSTSGEYGAWQFYIDNAVHALRSISALSNIAPYGITANTREHYPYGSYIAGGGASVCFQMAGAKDTFTDITTWKSYLTAQYAAGTPVCVWYVLATPETAVVNEPLMKIGDYADEVSGISIPVTAGANTLSVDTTVQPSEITVNYKGWHPAIVHERTNGAWD